MALPKPQLNGDVLAYDERQTDVLNDLEDIISNLVLSINPIGTIYTSSESTNPSSFIGGTWEEYGKGRVLVGLDATQTEFNSVGKIGGNKTHTLSMPELPPTVWNTTSGGTGGLNLMFDVGTSYGISSGGANRGKPHNNLQPYITVYRFRRIS